jgi:hypothetical protein
MAVSKRDELIAVADAQDKNGSGYLLGAQGQMAADVTDAYISKREHGNKKNIKRVKAFIKKMFALGFAAVMRLYDCSGYVLQCLAEIGIVLSDRTANGIYTDYCKAISKWDLCAGDCVFRRSSGKIVHIGIYCGDGTVLHCKGRDVGVVREKISKYSWNRYGSIKKLESGIVTAFQRVLKKGCKGEDVRRLQDKLIALGYDLGKWGADADFGSVTQKAVKACQRKVGLAAIGRCGPKTTAALGLIWAG